MAAGIVSSSDKGPRIAGYEARGAFADDSSSLQHGRFALGPLHHRRFRRG